MREDYEKLKVKAEKLPRDNAYLLAENAMLKKEAAAAEPAVAAKEAAEAELRAAAERAAKAKFEEECAAEAAELCTRLKAGAQNVDRFAGKSDMATLRTLRTLAKLL